MPEVSKKRNNFMIDWSSSQIAPFELVEHFDTFSVHVDKQIDEFNDVYEN